MAREEWARVILLLILQLSTSISGKVIVIDADLGLANVEILLGIMPKFTLLDVISKNASIKDVINRGPMEIGIIFGGSGIQSMAELSLYDMNKLLNEINALKDRFILIDAGWGYQNP